MLTKELIANVRRIEIRTRKAVDQLTGGAYHSVFKGRGMEFDEVREYLPGDDVRTIDWNVTARFGHPYIKKFVEERELTVLLLVDISGSGDFGSAGRSKNQVAAELAALLAFSAIRNNDRVGLLQFTDRQELFVPPRKGRRHVLRVVRELLASERQQRGTDIRQALEAMMRLMPRRAVVFLISDMLDDGFGQTLTIANKRHDLIGLRIHDPHELQLPKSTFLMVEDAEDERLVCFNGASKAALKDWHVETNVARLEQTDIFRKASVDLIDLVSGEDIIKPLMQFFRAREKRR
jgi:uncharacterized protein (DUF58 family)